MEVSKIRDQPYLLRIQEEEDIVGYVTGQALNSFEGRRLLGGGVNPETRIGWVFPTGLRGVVDSYKGILPDVDFVVRRHTRVPLYIPFLTKVDAARVHEHHVGQFVPGIAALLGMGTGHTRGVQAICPECLADDIKRYGYPLWRRLNLMPGVTSCPLHKRETLRFCNLCCSGTRRYYATARPSSRCVCGASLQPVRKLHSWWEEEMSIGVANMAFQMLRDEAPSNLGPSMLRHAIHGHLGGDGMSNAGISRRLEECLRDFFHDSDLASRGFGRGTMMRLSHRNESIPFVRDPILILTALWVLFRGWPCDAEPRLLQTKPKGKRSGNRSLRGDRYVAHIDSLPKSEAEALTTKYRIWLQGHLRAQPDLLRTELQAIPGSTAALRHFKVIDGQWFDETLPVRRRSNRARGLQSMEQEKRVEKLVQSIEERHRDSTEKQPFRRISRSFLLNHSKGVSAKAWRYLDSRVIEALEKCSDSSESWRERVTRHLCVRVRAISHGHDYGKLSTYEGLSQERFIKHVTMVKKWIQEHVAQ